MRFSGTISLPQEHFEKVLEFTARSFRAHGFLDIVLLGDSGGNYAGQRAVAQALNKEWASTSTRVHSVEANYDANGSADWLRRQGETAESIGTHAGTLIRLRCSPCTPTGCVVPNWLSGRRTMAAV